MQHVNYLKQERDSAFEEFKFQDNTLTRKDYINLRGSKISTEILKASRDLSTKPPQVLAESYGSSGRHLQQITYIESFKRNIKHDQIHFNNLKEEKHLDTWRRNTLAASRA